MKKTLYVVSVIVAVVCVAAVFNQPTRTSVVAGAPVTVDRSPDLQADRKRLIGKLVAQGVFTKLETPGTLPRVHTGRMWKALTFDEKQKFVSVVAAYAADPKDGYLTLVYDGSTNKQIGKFADVYGGLTLN